MKLDLKVHQTPLQLWSFQRIFQEGYEAALKGPPRPAELSSALIYSVKLASWKPPHFGLDVQCVAPILPKVESVVILLCLLFVRGEFKHMT